MGRPSKQRRSAQRPGRRERTRVKTSAAHGVRYVAQQDVAGGDSIEIRYGRGKKRRVYSFLDRRISEGRAKSSEFGSFTSHTIYCR